MLTILIDFLLRVATIIAVIASGWYAADFYSTTDDWSLGIIPLGCWLFMLSLLLYRSVVSIEVLTYGDYRVFGKRIGKTVTEGLHWRWWWQTIRLYSAKVRIVTVKETFTTNDKVEAEIEGLVQYVPDRELISKRFASLDEETVTAGLSSNIRETVGVIAGVYPYETLFKKREFISTMINCVLRMNHPPHLEIEALTWVNDRAKDKSRQLDEEKIRQTCRDADGREWITADKEVIPERRIEFYEKFAFQVRMLLDQEAQYTKVRSTTEKVYGIDVDHFNLPDTNWTPEFRNAIQEEKRAEGEVAGRTKKADAVKKLAEEIRKQSPNIQESTALHAAMAAHGLSTHQTIAVEGQTGSVIPIINPPAGGGGRNVT